MGNLKRYIAAAAVLLTTACAPEVTRVPMMKPSATALSGLARSFELVSDTRVVLHTGYERVLAKGSRWRLVGVIAAGAVYQALGSVLTVEGANIHEAYLVIRGADLVGFYLPVEQAYSPIANAAGLRWQAN
jgi:hypothetical protein